MKSMFEGKNWYKGNLHTHTSKSDGVLEPDRVIAKYKSQNYSFLSITDHDIYSDYTDQNDEYFMLIPGGEFGINKKQEERNSQEQFKCHHAVHVLADESAPGRLEKDFLFVDRKEPGGFDERVARAIDWGHGCGNFVILAHPHGSGLFEHSPFKFGGYDAMEVCNFSSEIQYAEGCSEQVWDYFLRNGKRIWAVASDDAHHKTNDSCGGWVMVSADELTIPSVMSAMKRGSFYASTGPCIESLTVGEGEITVKCSPCMQIKFVQYDHRGRVFRSADGKDSLTEATFKYHERAKYVRVECITSQRKKAWSNPIFFEGDCELDVFEPTDPAKEIVIPGGGPVLSGAKDFGENYPLRNGKLFKGALHAHTTNSDGKLSPAELCRIYRENGFSFVTISDHRRYTNTAEHDSEGFITLPGTELDVWCGSFDRGNTPETRQYTYHINGILADPAHPRVLEDGYEWTRPVYDESWNGPSSVREKVQEAIDFLRAHGNMVMLNHPNWSVNFETDCYGFDGLFAMEVYNNVCEQGCGNGLSEHFYEYLLANGMQLWQTATDDTHGAAAMCGGWVVVSAPELTREAIADALLRGRFYSSSGPEIYDYYAEGGRVHLFCSDARDVRFIHANSGGHVVRDDSVPVNRAVWRAPKGAYVYARVTGWDGSLAWTNPILIK